METCVTYAHNEFKLCSTWDHFPVYAAIQEYGGQGCFVQHKKKKVWAGWQPSDEDAKIECKKNVVGKREDDNKDSLVMIQNHT